VFLFREPTDELVRQVLAVQQDLPFTYSGVGGTRTGVLEGYPINHHRTRLGNGPSVYARAAAALHGWAMYRLSWTRLCWPDAPIAPGTAVAVVVHRLGFWSINPCRIVYTFEDSGEVERVGFALGTLPEHAERGEERFSVEWHHSDGSVWFEVFACAGANHWLSRVGYPLLRVIQRRFGKEALHAMHSAVQSMPA
jgi:uncharacterized protein (UPF0548 family)